MMVLGGWPRGDGLPLACSRLVLLFFRAPFIDAQLSAARLRLISCSKAMKFYFISAIRHKPFSCQIHPCGPSRSGPSTLPDLGSAGIYCCPSGKRNQRGNSFFNRSDGSSPTSTSAVSSGFHVLPWQERSVIKHRWRRNIYFFLYLLDRFHHNESKFIRSVNLVQAIQKA